MNKKSKNINLQKAKNTKNDEFYTQLKDIEREVINYKDQLKNKVIYCNCDNSEWSNFYKYFKDNFKDLGIKELISTYYEEGNITYKTIFNGIEENKTALIGNGDFRSNECLEILKASDVVITNPPFSLFREYIALLMKHNKKFIVIGAKGAIAYKKIFSLVKDNKIWLGVNKNNGTMCFSTNIDGTDLKSVPAYWYSNIDHHKKHEFLDLEDNYYHSSLYPKYVNHNSIEVGKISKIPCDYDGLMGVPITIFQHYNPEQFEIVGISDTLAKPMKDIAVEGSYTKGGKKFYIDNNDGTYRRMYSRVVIRLRNPIKK